MSTAKFAPHRRNIHRGIARNGPRPPLWERLRQAAEKTDLVVEKNIAPSIKPERSETEVNITPLAGEGPLKDRLKKAFKFTRKRPAP